MVDEPLRGSLPHPGFYSLPGIEQARAIVRGAVLRSPLSRLVGLRFTQVGPGSATVTMRASPWLQSQDGTVDSKMLLEAALHLGALSGAPPGSDITAVSLSVSHLRPCTLEGQQFVARARVVHSGENFTVTDAELEDALGRSVAHATGTYQITPMDPPPPELSCPLPAVDEPAYSVPDPPLRPPPDKGHLFEAMGNADGISLCRAALANELPVLPVLGVVGQRTVDIGEGTVVLNQRASEWLCGFSRRVQPGPIASLIHIALGGTVLTLAPPAHRTGVIDQSIDFLRPVVADGRNLLIRGRVVHEVGQFLVSHVEVTDAEGSLVAIGHQTSVLIDRGGRVRETRRVERTLATVVFTDIVGSTARAQELGDVAWQQLLAEHDAVVRRQLEVWKGREVKTLGDGFLATFDSPARAVQFGRAVGDEMPRLGLQLRVGIHTGECELVGADVAGIAVHVAARIQGAAEPGEVLVSGTVRDLVAGSGIRFALKGEHQLKGIEGDWPLFVVVR